METHIAVVSEEKEEEKEEEQQSMMDVEETEMENEEVPYVQISHKKLQEIMKSIQQKKKDIKGEEENSAPSPSSPLSSYIEIDEKEEEGS